VSLVIVQEFLVQLTRPSLLPHSYRGILGTYVFSSHRESLVHLTKLSQSIRFIFIDTEIHMVLKIPQGGHVPLSHHC
jgi:hypothetical protein